MRNSAMSSRSILALLLGGLLLIACIAGSHSAAAFGMGGFGHMGGFGGRPMPGGGPMAGPRPGVGPGGGGLVGRSPGRNGGWPSRHPPIVGGGGGSGYVGGGGGPVGPGNSGGNRNNGGGGAPQQGNQNFVPNEVITAFAPGATPQAINQVARRYELTQLDSQSFSLVGTSLYRWRLGGGRTVATRSGRLAANASSPACNRTTFSRCRKRPSRLPPARRAMRRNMFWRNCKVRKRSKWQRARMSWLP